MYKVIVIPGELSKSGKLMEQVAPVIQQKALREYSKTLKETKVK